MKAASAALPEYQVLPGLRGKPRSEGLEFLAVHQVEALHRVELRLDGTTIDAL